MIVNWKIKSFEQLNSFELYKILQLRINVFMLEQNCLYPECDDKDFKAYHLVGMDENGIIAYARLLPPGISYTEASIGRVVVATDYRGKQVGYKLMQRAQEYIESEFGTNLIRISAQAHLEKFYTNLGFKVVSDKYLEDGIPHVEMLYIQKEEE